MKSLCDNITNVYVVVNSFNSANYYFPQVIIVSTSLAYITIAKNYKRKTKLNYNIYAKINVECWTRKKKRIYFSYFLYYSRLNLQ